MKKIISIFLIVILLLTSDTATVSAATHNQGRDSSHQYSGWNFGWDNGWNGWNTNWNNGNNGNNNGNSNQNNTAGNDLSSWDYDWSNWGYNWGYNWWGGTTWTYSASKSPTIKYGSYKIPTSPFTEGMGASTKYDKKKKVFSVNRGNIAIDIYLKDKKVYVNGAPDPYSGIFTAKDSKKSKALIMYIANILGVQITFQEDNVTVVTPGLDVPGELAVTAVGGTVLKNTLNSTNLYLKASAKIKAGQATGGRAELYVGSKLVATDNAISSTDTTVNFTTSDNSPTNSELKAAVPSGGMVTVRLYNIYNNVVTSTANPTLAVDYNPPAIEFGSSDKLAANYNAANGKLYITLARAGVIGDKVDVTKLTFYNAANNRYTLTNTNGSTSGGVITGTTTLEITLSPIDQYYVANLGNAFSLYLLIGGAVLYDTSGNRSPENITQRIPVNQSASAPVPSVLSAPTKVTIIPSGGTVVANTLNKTNLSMKVTAQITPNQAIGGKAELYIGKKLIATDPYIYENKSQVTFTVPDGNATSERLQAAISAGGVVTVRLYNTNQNYVTSAVSNPTLQVDYKAPTISGIYTAGYNADAGQLYLFADGTADAADKVELSRITLFDAANRSITLSNAIGTAVIQGAADNQQSPQILLLINVGETYKEYLKTFHTTAYLRVSAGTLISDTAGNPPAGFTTDQVIRLAIIKPS